jgi:2-oxoglutarate ferredoxin oxidoreductase subunit gamma
MEIDIVFGGTGGQGVQLATQLLAQAATLEGKNALQYCDYTSEMRGGKIDCTVVVADAGEEIGSPRRPRPRAVVAMSPRALDEYGPGVRPGGLLLVNASMVDPRVLRRDCDVFLVPTLRLAAEVGEARTVSMIAVGALVGRLGIVAVESLVEALRAVVPAHRQKLIAVNEKALRRGAAYAVETSVAPAG